MSPYEYENKVNFKNIDEFDNKINDHSPKNKAVQHFGWCTLIKAQI